MSNIERAVETILTETACSTRNANRAAQALADAELLAPELPEPDEDGYWVSEHTEPAWEGTEIEHPRPITTWVEEPGVIGMGTATSDHIITAHDARTVAAALLAAAAWAEKQ